MLFRSLWPAVRRVVSRLKPGVVFFENVDGHITMGLWKILRDIERIGYRATAGCFSAEEVGAPHLRKRVFILGVSDRPEQGRFDQPGPRQDRRAAAGRPSEGVGDAKGQRERESNDAECAVAREGSRGDDRGPSGQLADGPREGLQGEVEDGSSFGRPADDRRPARSGRGIFPPGLDDYVAWARLVEAEIGRAHV